MVKVALHTLSIVHEAATPAVPAAPVKASVEVMNGPNAGKTLRLVKPLTTLGTPGVLVVVIGRQEQRFFIRQVDGHGTALVNGQGVGSEQRYLADGDMVDLAGTLMKFSVIP